MLYILYLPLKTNKAEYNFELYINVGKYIQQNVFNKMYQAKNRSILTIGIILSNLIRSNVRSTYRLTNINYKELLRILTRKRHPQIKLKCLQKV